MFLHTIDTSEIFHPVLPPLPMGKYAHIVILRETNSFPLFQTDQELNFARVSPGRDEGQSDSALVISRIVLFKRKQTTPERLTGRELLRRYQLISNDGEDKTRICEYNSEHFCKRCPDCIYYGFAIGQEGSERSKVLVDSAFSLSHYDESHLRLTFNAPYEHGTMSREGETTSRFGEQDHVLPQVFFPSVITLRDPTETGFLYILNNVLRTKRYGAQTTRTGTLENHIVALIFSDGEIFSNLKLTQTLYDKAQKPYHYGNLLQNMRDSLPALLKEDHVTVHLLLEGEQLQTFMDEVNTLMTQQETLTQILQQAYAESESYSKTYGAMKKEANEENKRKAKAAKAK